ncbi:YeeE/YedE family protein [Paracoccus suum]|uniref:YeeE/YedE family protein n=1 Tax=Paracoccus suum TaxID=2259340 RepID=A0A344PKU6_9RHOB|nr:YeeE/YedE family protein [Paracoccus suum]AXC50001.1 YeeE/YedE family protein [Paracoccus suum]
MPEFLAGFTVPQLAVGLGLVIGLAFGALAERSAFCFRRALVGSDRREAMGVWMTALAVAILGTEAAVMAGLITFDGHRLLAPDLPIAAVILGGLLFGAGMVLSRGCISRLTILGGSGNLRALTTILVVAVIAHATLKGILAPLRTAIGSVTVPLGARASLASLPGGPLLWTLVLAALAILIALRSGGRPRLLVLGALIGLLVPAAWIGTGWLLADEFDPITMEALSFTGPGAEALFWVIAATSIPAGFGTGLVGGVLLGSLVTSLLAGSFRTVSFSSPRETRRYMAGAALMSFGGVLAGGCTLGAGLSGIPTLSVAAILALVAIAVGAKATHALVDGQTADLHGAPIRA